ncbi:MAG TPA: hypothetical protein VMD59_13385 [Acidimicrobiales bacterium]|nr:hypothetical protein [Acidimicrobiales bacterium]
MRSPDVVLIADGGGLAAAALAPIHGSRAVATVLTRADQLAATVETTVVWLNGAPAVLLEREGRLAAASLLVETSGSRTSTPWRTRRS